MGLAQVASAAEDVSFAGMSGTFDGLAAAEALEAAGGDPAQAKAHAAQLQAAAHAAEPVTQDRMNSALARQELRLVRWMPIVGSARRYRRVGLPWAGRGL